MILMMTTVTKMMTKYEAIAKELRSG
jgi:hypothetical protein